MIAFSICKSYNITDFYTWVIQVNQLVKREKKSQILPWDNIATIDIDWCTPIIYLYKFHWFSKNRILEWTLIPFKNRINMHIDGVMSKGQRNQLKELCVQSWTILGSKMEQYWTASWGVKYTSESPCLYQHWLNKLINVEKRQIFVEEFPKLGIISHLSVGCVQFSFKEYNVKRKENLTYTMLDRYQGQK